MEVQYWSPNDRCWRIWDPGSIPTRFGDLGGQGTVLCGSCGFNLRDAHTEFSYDFDARRIAMLLIAGDKTGDDPWYDRCIPVADRIYAEHLIAIEKKGSKDG